jgi:hypothetical protein
MALSRERQNQLQFFAGYVGVVVHLGLCASPLTLPALVRWLLIALCTAAVALGAACRAGTSGSVDGTSATGWKSLSAGIQRLGPGVLPLALLPMVGLIHSSVDGALLVGICAAAILRLAWRRDAKVGPASPLRHDDVGPWELSLLALTVAFAGLYLIRGSHATVNLDNDSAYYFGVARYITSSGRLEEPIIWHYLSPPMSIVHRPFDYWAPVTSLLLVPALATFGNNIHVALVVMAALSAASIIAFWYLVCVALPIRNPAVQLLAIALYSWSPWMAGYRFDTESVPIFQLWLVLALVALAKRRYAWAVAASFLLVVTRAEGVVFCSLLWAASLVAAFRWPTEHRSGRVGAAATTAVSLAVLYAGWNFYLFRTLLPPGARAVQSLQQYSDLYAYGKAHDTSVLDLLRRFSPSYIAERIQALLAGVDAVKWFPSYLGWIVLGLVPVAELVRRPSAKSFIWLLFFGGIVLLTWASPQATFMPERTFGALLPLVVLVGAFGADYVILLVEQASSRYHRVTPRLAMITICFFSLLLASVTLGGVTIYGDWPSNKSTDSRIAQLDELFAGQPVASTLPWQILSLTHSPVITIPGNGEAAIEAAVNRYNVRWIVLTQVAYPWIDESYGVVNSVAKGTRTQIGRLRLEKVREIDDIQIFRIVR